MFGNRYRNKSRQKDEGEKPFWISFADLMTALMTLFLVVMAAAVWLTTNAIKLNEVLRINERKGFAGE